MKRFKNKTVGNHHIAFVLLVLTVSFQNLRQKKSMIILFSS